MKADLKSKEEKPARSEAEVLREAFDEMNEARRLFTLDIPNSGHAIGLAIEGKHVQGVQDGVKLLQRRLKRAVELAEIYFPTPAETTPTH